MSNEPSAAGDAAHSEQGEHAIAPSNEVLSAGMVKARSFWRSKRFLIAAPLGAIALAVAAWYLLPSDPDAEQTTVAQPTAAEQFAPLLAEIQKSDDPVARIDAITIDDSMLQTLTAIDRLTTVQVQMDSVTLESITKLSQMPKLEQLHLRGGSINDEMLRQLATSQTIWLLNLPTMNVSPEAIQELGKMPLLRQLRIGVANGDNRHARAVATLGRLRAVHLIGIGVTDEGLQALGNMSQLESLYIDDSAITDAGWTWLFQNRPQLHVHINQKHHDRDPQKH